MRVWTLLILVLVGCGPGLAQQRELGALSRAARLRCQADRARCEQAKACALAVQTAVRAIQTAQESRARGELATQVEVTAGEADTHARAQCAVGGGP